MHQRTKYDASGKRALNADAYHGIHTLRAMEHFPLSDMRRQGPFIAALARCKHACALSEGYSLAIHCGPCMLHRTEMLPSMKECRRRSVPVTNHGVSPSNIQGGLPRLPRPFGRTDTAEAKTCMETADVC